MIELTRRGLLLSASAFGLGLALRPTSTFAAQRANYALVVACTTYPSLPRANWLVGPNHDARLARDFLTTAAPVKFDPANVTVLADNLDIAAGSPTHESILATLQDIATKATRDDFVYVHLSGHGSYQPELVAGSETTGYDQIFLPQNIQKWADDAGRIPNALVDDEIGAALDAIRDKGAFVWCVIDACHSGTATRAAVLDDGVMVQRKVEPADLGIPQARLDAAAASSRDVGPAPKAPYSFADKPTSAEAIDKGKLVAFYAAQTVETTPEMPLPRGVDGATSYGLFTYTIFSEMAKNPNMTYRQLGQAVLQQYAAAGMQRPTPLFEGELDAPVFGSQAEARVLQWPIQLADGAATLPAGLVQSVTAGSKLAIIPTAATDTANAVGYLEVTTADNLSSSVRPVAYDKKPAIGIDELPANAFARLTDVAVDFELLVARPSMAPANAGLDAELAKVGAVLDKVTSATDKRFQVKLVDAGKPADIRLVVMRENAVQGAAPNATDGPALWFLPASGDIEPNGAELPPMIALSSDKLETATAANLETIFRATSLARVGSAVGATVPDVDVQFQIKRVSNGAMEPLLASAVPDVGPDDQVHIAAVNNSDRHVDINILYIGSDYSISRLAVERLAPQAALKKGLFKFTDTTFGTERMLAILTPAPPLSPIEDLKYLEQGGVPSATRDVTAPGGNNTLKGLLNDVGLAPVASRSAALLDDSASSESGGAVMMFPVHTRPRA